MTEPRKQVDWEKIESVYRTGVKSLRDIAADHRVSHVAIDKRAKKFGWTKDLAEKIQAKADELVNKALVNKSVNTDELVNDRDIIAGVATTQADIRTQQMTRATDNRKTIESMLDELKIQNTTVEELSKLGEILADPETRVDKLSEIYHKVISFGGRVDSAKKLIESWVKATESECRVYGIEEKPKKIDINQKTQEIPEFIQELILGNIKTE